MRKKLKMTKESLEHHIKHLTDVHDKLEKKIFEGHSHYLDDPTLTKIKQERVHVARELEATKDKLKAIK